MMNCETRPMTHEIAIVALSPSSKGSNEITIIERGRVFWEHTMVKLLAISAGNRMSQARRKVQITKTTCMPAATNPFSKNMPERSGYTADEAREVAIHGMSANEVWLEYAIAVFQRGRSRSPGIPGI